MLGLDSLEECLEVSSAEALMVSSLNDLQEEGWSVLSVFCKNLQKVSFFVVVDQDLQLSEGLDVFLHLKAGVLETVLQSIVVSIWDLLKELNTTVSHSLHSGDDILSAHGDVLHTSASVVVNILLNLGLTHTVGWFVNWHLDVLIKVSNDNRSQGGVVGVDHLVIDGPESVEVKHLLVPRGSSFHLTVWLVTDAVVHVLQVWNWELLVEDLLQVVSLVSWEEWSLVVNTLDESVDSVAVGADR